MSRVRSKNTKIDLKMKKIVSSLNYKYEMYPKMFGRPDLIIKKKKIVIFCDGDFWHGYKYHVKKKPAKKYWKKKIKTNMVRDRQISRRLRYIGWSVLRFWEHDIEKRPELCMEKIKRKISSKSQF